MNVARAQGAVKFAAPAGDHGEGYGSGEDDDEEEKPTTLAEAAMDEALQEEDDAKRKMTAYLAGRPVASALTNEDDRPRWRNRYIALGDWCYSLTMGDGFNQFITLTIALAIILVGCQTYPSLQNDPTVKKLESIVLDIFVVECVLKFVSESTHPLKYLTGPRGWWNVLDVSIVIMCMPWLPVGSSGAILRLARLSRIGKVVEKVPKLRVLLGECCYHRRYRRLAAAPLRLPADTSSSRPAHSPPAAVSLVSLVLPRKLQSESRVASTTSCTSACCSASASTSTAVWACCFSARPTRCTSARSVSPSRRCSRSLRWNRCAAPPVARAAARRRPLVRLAD